METSGCRSLRLEFPHVECDGGEDGPTMHGLIVKGLDLLPKIETGRGTESLGTGERRSLRDRGFL